MAEIKKIFIVCGEPSGDLLAGNLILAIKKINPTIKISGVGGAHVAQAGAEILYNIQNLAVFGFFDVLKKLPLFFKLKKFILEKIETDKPDVIIFVDFSGFNLRLARAINKRIPAIYYVSPQLWASRKGRIKSVKKFISQMVVLFKFEEEFYKQQGIPAVCAGHPLIDIVKPALAKQEFIDRFQLSPDKKTIALLPGSRKQEIRLILPVMLEASRIIHEQIPGTQFVIAKFPQLDAQFYQEECKKYNLDLKIVDGKAYDCLKNSAASLVCSGTATLEATIIQNPFVIIYKTNLLNYLLYRPQVKIPYIGMVNIIAGRKIVPEFVQFGASPKIIAKAIIELLEKPETAKRMVEDLSHVKKALGEPGAADRAAKLILEFLSR